MSVTLPSHLSPAALVVPSARGLLVWAPRLKPKIHALDQVHARQMENSQQLSDLPVGKVAYVRRGSRTSIMVALPRPDIDVGVLFAERTWPAFKAITHSGDRLFLIPETLPSAVDARRLSRSLNSRRDPDVSPGVVIRVDPSTLDGLSEPRRWTNQQFADAAQRFRLVKAKAQKRE